MNNSNEWNNPGPKDTGKLNSWGNAGGAGDSGDISETRQFAAYTEPEPPETAGNSWHTSQAPASSVVIPPAGAGPHPAPRRSNAGLIVAVIILLLAVVAAGTMAYFFWPFGGDDAEHEAQPPAVPSTQSPGAGEQTSPSTTEEGTTTSEESPRPAHPNLPSNAEPVNDAARNNEPAGDFNNIYLSGATSPSFATAVRDAYVEHFLDTGDLNAVLSGVYSSSTGKNYSISCTDNGEYVHCQGGNTNNAHVYIS